eukprot:COSAG05_NODE_5880_length_1067_cov_1.483471_1_plen_276_part_01
MTDAVLNYSSARYRDYVEGEGGSFVAFLYGDPYFDEAYARVAAENPGATKEEVEALYSEWLASPPPGEGARRQEAIAARSAEYSAAYIEEQSCHVWDARTQLADASLETNGFQLVRHTSKVPLERLASMDDDAAALYRGEVMEMLKEITGAPYAFCDEQLVRKEAAPGAENPLTGIGDEPVFFVHNDFTSGYREDVLAAFEGTGGTYTFGALEQMRAAGMTLESLRESRIIVCNTWRSISPVPLRRKPLALCDMRTVREEDWFGERLGDSGTELET